MESSQLINKSEVVVNSISSNNQAVDSSFFSMFWNAGFVIKMVILTLLVASIYSWTIIISKYLRLKKLTFNANSFEDEFWSGAPLENLYKEIKETILDPMGNIFCAAMAEWKRFSPKSSNSEVSLTQSLEKRVDRAMNIAIKKEIDELEKGMGFLSSLGTNGVIIGLFGTVLGILNGFKAIALQQSASISTVGPIISEALVTTALGILAAIPAAVGYNKLMNDINRYISRLETFSEEFSSIISRQFDER